MLCLYKIMYVLLSVYVFRCLGNFIAFEINTRDSYTRVVFECFIFGGCGLMFVVVMIGFNVCFVVVGFEFLLLFVVVVSCIFVSVIFMSWCSTVFGVNFFGMFVLFNLLSFVSVIFRLNICVLDKVELFVYVCVCW